MIHEAFHRLITMDDLSILLQAPKQTPGPRDAMARFFPLGDDLLVRQVDPTFEVVPQLTGSHWSTSELLGPKPWKLTAWRMDCCSPNHDSNKNPGWSKKTLTPWPKTRRCRRQTSKRGTKTPKSTNALKKLCVVFCSGIRFLDVFGGFPRRKPTTSYPSFGSINPSNNPLSCCSAAEAKSSVLANWVLVSAIFFSSILVVGRQESSAPPTWWLQKRKF